MAYRGDGVSGKVERRVEGERWKERGGGRRVEGEGWRETISVMVNCYHCLYLPMSPCDVGERFNPLVTVN